MSLKKPKTAMVYGAGLGTRMRPLTDDKPKPLVEVCGKPIIEYALDKLSDFGIEKVIVNTHYEAKKLEDYLKRYKRLKVETIYEETLLETGGGIVNALPKLGEDPFFVINGDIIWIDNNKEQPLLEKICSQWRDSTKAVLAIKEVTKAIGYSGTGDFDVSYDDEVCVKLSKEEIKPYVFMGVHLLDPKILHDRHVRPFSIIEIYRENISGNILKNVRAIKHTGPWLHIGTPEGVTESEEFIRNQL